MLEDTGPGADSRSIEARIARVLSDSVIRPPVGGAPPVPPAYIRRHLCEHASAGACLNADVIPLQLLPFLDVNRFREQAAEAAQGPPHAAAADTPPESLVSWSALLALVRRVSHVWDWEHPYQNAAALQFWAAAGQMRLPLLEEMGSWRVLWAKSPGPSEIIGRPKSVVVCVAAGVLPAGGGVAVTGGRDGTLCIWNLASGTTIQMPTRGGAIRAIAIVNRPDELPYAVSGSSDGALRLWDGLGGTSSEPVLIAEHLGGAGVTAMAAVLYDRHPVVLFGRQDGSLRVWDLERDSLANWSASHEDPATGIATATQADGQRVAVTVRLDGTLQMWELPAYGTTPRAITRAIRGHSEAVRAVATATLPGGQAIAVTGSDDGSVRLWDLEHGVPIGNPLIGHRGKAVTAVSTWTLPDRQYAISAGRDHSLQAWTLPEGDPAGELLEGHSLDVTAVAAIALPGGRAIAVSAGEDYSLRTWDLTQILVKEPRPRSSARSAVPGANQSSSRSPALVPAVRSGDVQIWDLHDGQQLDEVFQPDVRAVISIATGSLPDGRRIVITGCEHQAELHHEPRQAGLLAGRRTSIVATVPDDGVFAVTGGNDGFLRFWDLVEHRLIGKPLAGHSGSVTALATLRLADKIILVSAGTDRTVRTWNITRLVDAASGPEPVDLGDLTGRPLLREDGSVSHDGPIAALAAVEWNSAPIVVSGSNTAVQVWDLTDHKPLGGPIELLTHPVTAIAAADIKGRLRGIIGSEGDGAVHVWDLERGRTDFTLLGHQRPVTAIAIAASPGGAVIAFTASSDHTVRAWDIQGGRPVGDALPLPGIPRAVAGFDNPDGPSVVVGGNDVLAALQLRGA